MRTNEYTTLDEFINEYTGVWNPSEEHWFGLDFKFGDDVYRLNTGSMYNEINTILPDGREALFGLYKKMDDGSSKEFVMLGEYADMDDLLKNGYLNNTPFREVIVHESTEILGKD